MDVSSDLAPADIAVEIVVNEGNIIALGALTCIEQPVLELCWMHYDLDHRSIDNTEYKACCSTVLAMTDWNRNNYNVFTEQSINE